VSAWIAVGRIEDIPALGARVVRTLGGDVAVFRTADDRIFAVDDRCPHRGGPLSQGIVHGGRVTCPLHDWSIDLEAGQAVSPDHGCVTTYSVRINDGQIEIDLEAVNDRLVATS